MLSFLKIAPYNPLKENLNKYESLCLLTRGEFDPGIDRQASLCLLTGKLLDLKSFEKIFVSNSKRARQTYEFLSAEDIISPLAKYHETAMLNEIRFDMHALCTPAEYKQQGSDIVRERFLDFFIADCLLESRADIRKRFEELKNITEENKKFKILFISHTFNIKLFQIYLAEGERFFSNPQIIKNYINPKVRIMEFLELSDRGFIAPCNY
jgi:hypothetical protein